MKKVLDKLKSICYNKYVRLKQRYESWYRLYKDKDFMKLLYPRVMNTNK